jgi:prolyl-tRNA synthetase
MQDRKALQAGTSHFLGQNFSQAQEIRFQNEHGQEEYAWTTSWGVSTRLVGGLIMTHSDDDGLVLPPRLAPKHVVLLPIYRSDEERATVLDFCRSLQAELGEQEFAGRKVQVLLDDRDVRGGEKVWWHIKRGVPLRAEIGPRDVAANSVFLGRRDKGPKEKAGVPRDEFVANVGRLLDEIQNNFYQRALELRQQHTRPIDNLDEFRAFFTPKNEDAPEIHGGFADSPFVEDPAVLELLKDLKVTIRCIPVEQSEEPGTCVFTGKPTTRRAIFAKAY